ncbi:MAG TPA: GNAT family N-acetyltransferase [Candidatus Cybelea sp.]|jgi:CelD/BcsL family acetyltransferase involved in cellulose biosynthesis|nr:GNAT family N-acetyltransferase [Candidatus Cybelea sp.]
MTPLHVDAFTRFEELDALEPRWRELFEADSHAHFFLCWEWIRACLQTERLPWLVLGVREVGGPYVAFLALGYGQFPSRGPAVNRELYLAGIPRSDYTGMLVVPGVEARAVAALASYIDALPWDNFTLNDCADERVAMLVERLGSEKYFVTTGEPTPCPFAALPATWDEYLAARSVATRRTLRTKMRKVEALPGYRFRWAPPEEAREMVELLLQMNSARWNKGLQKRRRIFGDLFRLCYASGRFVVATLHDGETLLAAQGSFLEPKSKTVLGYMMGYNADFAKLSPGAILVAMSIRHAIEQGYKHYDFARGGEEFKRSFCSERRYTHHTKLTRRGFRVAAINAGRSGLVAAKGVARAFLRRPA